MRFDGGGWDDAAHHRTHPSLGGAFGPHRSRARIALPRAVRRPDPAAPARGDHRRRRQRARRAPRHNDTACHRGARRHEPDRDHDCRVAGAGYCPPIPFLLACYGVPEGAGVTLQAIRDIAIIILAVESIVVATAAIVLIWQVWKLVGLARQKFELLTDGAGDILDSAKDTA